jgi:beta-glucosidase
MGEPVTQLRGFEKVYLLPGETELVKVPVGPSELSIWDVPSHSWVPVRGLFSVEVGASASDVRISGYFTV